MLVFAVALLIAQAIPPPPPGYVVDKNPFDDFDPPCRNGAKKCPPWERDRVVVPAGWTMIGRDASDSIWAIHDSTMTSDRTLVRVWVRIDHSRDRAEPARMTRGLLSITCVSRQYWWRSLVAFDAAGRPLPERWSASGPLDNIAPDSMEEVIWRRVCQL